MSEQGSGVTLKLSEKEKRLLGIIRRVKKGELHITVAGGDPVKVDDIRRNIEL